MRISLFNLNSLLKKKQNYSEIRLPRTIESTIFEFFLLVEVLVAWVICGYLWAKVDTIPTHFNAQGEADAWGDPTVLIFFALMDALVLGLLAYSAYHPKMVNSTVKVVTIEQHLINARMVRVLGVIVGIMFILICLKMGGAIFGMSDRVFAISMFIIVLMILGVAVGFSIVIHLKRKR